jgi:hypothetical protein
LTWRVYEDDFFPYVTNDTFWRLHQWDGSADGYWTGFYTSRPQLKGDVRSAENVLRHAEILYSFSRISFQWNRQESFQRMETLRQSTAECCHHDAVAGTSTDPVVEMYEDHLHNGEDNVYNVTLEAVRQQMVNNQSMEAPELAMDSFKIAANLNQGQTIAVVLHNALGWSVNTFYRIFSTRRSYTKVL